MTEHRDERPAPAPPSGWYTFGTHAGWDGEDIPPLEFSEETDEAGMPLWERPKPSDVTEGEVVEVLSQPVHAPMYAHDPRDGGCRSCPWPLHMVEGPEGMADAILAAFHVTRKTTTPQREETP